MLAVRAVEVRGSGRDERTGGMEVDTWSEAHHKKSSHRAHPPSPLPPGGPVPRLAVSTGLHSSQLDDQATSPVMLSGAGCVLAITG